MALKRNSNEQYVKNAAMMHDDASYVPVATGATNPLPVDPGTEVAQNITLHQVGLLLSAMYEEQKLTNELLKGILQ